MEIISRHQCAAARALLDMSQGDLANSAGVSLGTISGFESGKTANPKLDILQSIGAALEAEGIEFTEGNGVKERTSGIVTYHGRDGFIAFFDDVYRTVRRQGGEFCVSNVDEHQFGKWLGDAAAPYKAKMAELTNFNARFMILEGDDYFAGGRYAEYRWVSKEDFDRVPFYAYGDKLAIILFQETAVTVYVIHERAIAEAFRSSFNRQWDRARIPAVPGRLDA